MRSTNIQAASCNACCCSINDGVQAILEDLSGIYEVRNSAQNGALITEITKKQRDVIEALGADPDSWLQNEGGLGYTGFSVQL